MRDVLRALHHRALIIPALALALALALAACFFAWHTPAALSAEEARLYQRILDGQRTLWATMEERGLADAATDPQKTGFIGLDWSETSTTLGSLDAKQNACNPLWAVQALRWFDTLGLKKGDRVVVLSSSSFPGMLFSVLAAAEARGLAIDLTVSLGSSAWGANRPEAPWPTLARALTTHGHLHTRPLFYTLGGNDERAAGMFPEGAKALTDAAMADATELYVPDSADAITARKMALITPQGGRAAKLVVSIGGPATNLGKDEAIISLKNGLLTPDTAKTAGNGLVAKSLEAGIPVIHILNIRGLAKSAGIPYQP